LRSVPEEKEPHMARIGRTYSRYGDTFTTAAPPQPRRTQEDVASPLLSGGMRMAAAIALLAVGAMVGWL
jgi:hypothetical protein